MAVALHAAAQHRSFQHVERSKQGRRAVADVVVGHGGGPTRLQRQPWLGAAESLDLALLIHREHDRMSRGST
jgi:hypothetical protein